MILARTSFLLLMALLSNVPMIVAQTTPRLIILGTLQDGGSPHMGCTRDCCKKPDPQKKVVSLGLIDALHQKKYLFEATPDIVSQLKDLQLQLPGSNVMPDGIFLTHAHIGHYTGLMYLGREAMNSQQVPVYAMPIFQQYLTTNGPWSQLVKLKNIKIETLVKDQEVMLENNLGVTPIQVPHRDEFSETVGFLIRGPHKKVLFIPDIDKWSKWDHAIRDMIAAVDYALIDATFFSNAEVGYRNINEIPHPLVEETMQLLSDLPATQKKKIRFIHLNHTNPLLNKNSLARRSLASKGFKIAEIGQEIDL